MKTIRSKRIPLSETIQLVGNILCSQRGRAFSEEELRCLVGENTRPVELRQALSVLKSWRGVEKNEAGLWRYCGMS